MIQSAEGFVDKVSIIFELGVYCYKCTAIFKQSQVGGQAMWKFSTVLLQSFALFTSQAYLHRIKYLASKDKS